jgi:hypothetical protein
MALPAPRNKLMVEGIAPKDRKLEALAIAGPARAYISMA